MSRFTTDLARGRPRSSVTVFFDGGDPALAARIARYRAAAGGRADLLWRDTRLCRDALTLWGIGARAAARRVFVKDRLARLFRGLGARLVLWRELDAYRWRAVLLDALGIAAFATRPIAPRRRHVEHHLLLDAPTRRLRILVERIGRAAPYLRRAPALPRSPRP